MALTPILAITDGTTRVSLHTTGGVYLRDWLPGRPQDKKVRRDPAFGGGAQVVINDYGNVVDTLEIGIRGPCQDDVISTFQDLDRLLQKAINYWASTWTSEPVWLEVRGGEETNTRYAVIRDYQIDGVTNPYAQPFVSAFHKSSLTRLTLAIEHDIWQASVPGTATCVELYHESQIDKPVEVQEVVTQSTDDCYIVSSGAYDDAGTDLYMGRDATPLNFYTGLRFQTVNVPKDATILNAYLRFECSTTNGINTCNLRIYGEAVDDAVTYSNYANFVARTLTTAYRDWLNVEDWTVNNTYYSVNFANVVQEIVNRAGWAANQDMAFHINENAITPSTVGAFRLAASWDHAGLNPPELHITYASGVTTTGFTSTTATCLDLPYVANHHHWEDSTLARGITHAFTWDESALAFSANLIVAGPPHNLFPATPPVLQSDDCLYVGAVDTSTSATGDKNIFDNLIFNIGTAATYNTAAFSTESIWEYWTGTAWAALNWFDETGASGINDEAFSITGTHSVHWELPSTWTPTEVNGIMAYWVRCRLVIDPAGGIVTTPTQTTRGIYTCRWACVDIDADQVPGDIPALARWRIHQRSDTNEGSGMYIPASYSSLYMGLRSITQRDDGQDDLFSAYIPLASDQLNAEDTVSYYSDGGNYSTSEALDYHSPYGGLAAYYVALSDHVMSNVIYAGQTVSLGTTPRRDGTYHMFVRYRMDPGGATAGDLILGMHTGRAAAPTEKRVVAQPTDDIEVADFGRVQLLSAYGRSPAESTNAPIYLQVECTVVGLRYLYFYDIILIPADEWYCKVTVDTATGDVLDCEETLDIDSVLTPKNRRLCVVRNEEKSAPNYAIYFPWTRQGAGPNILQPNAKQRIWFFGRMHETPDPSPPTGNQLGTFTLSASVRCEAAARYLTARGER